MRCAGLRLSSVLPTPSDKIADQRPFFQQSDHYWILTSLPTGSGGELRMRAYLLHPLLQHLESPGSFASILFIDFSSAINTIQRHHMIEKLHRLNLSPYLIHWIYNFLSNRPLAVRVGSVTSSTMITNTGAPQGCVLSPFLYTLYTNDCISPSSVTTYFKYSDDTAILALLTDNNSIISYHSSVTHFIRWCSINSLELNVDKTKDLLIYTHSNIPDLAPIIIHDKQWNVSITSNTLDSH
ncbi:hypothetical protein WMY93_032562 [Mugilogobius chulae]|uniref:Reverse transcriptase domain-containing protein n=1 Tax=Mugilogobius chulae TaxID=88201 RepID=A0AAW0MJ80_9GOBI